MWYRYHFHYKIIKQTFWKTNNQEFINLYFHLYSYYIKGNIFLVKSCTFGFILKKCASVTTDMHWHSENLPELCAFTIWSPDQCLVLRNETIIEADYCDISLWPTTALTTSLITDVSYCCVDRIYSLSQAQGCCGWMYCTERDASPLNIDSKPIIWYRLWNQW